MEYLWVSQKLCCLRCRKHLYSNDNSQWQIGIWIFRDNSGTPKSSGMWTLHLMFFCKLFCCKGKYCPSCPKVRRRKDTSILYDYIFKTSADNAQRMNASSFYFFYGLTVNGICLFWQLNGIWGGVVPPPLRSQELQKVWPWNFYQMLVYIRRHEIKKIFWFRASL